MRKGLIALAVSLVVVAVAPAASLAAGNAQSGPTVGDCISDIFYGNEPNMADGSPGGPAEQQPGTKGGNVLPSQSPGPKKTLPDGTVVPGSSVGDYQQAGVSIPALCRAYAGH